MQANLDYGTHCWTVYQGNMPIPGENVLMVGGGVRRLIEWCFDNGIQVLLSDAACIVFELERYKIRQESLAAILNK